MPRRTAAGNVFRAEAVSVLTVSPWGFLVVSTVVTEPSAFRVVTRVTELPSGLFVNEVILNGKPEASYRVSSRVRMEPLGFVVVTTPLIILPREVFLISEVTQPPPILMDLSEHQTEPSLFLLPWAIREGFVLLPCVSSMRIELARVVVTIVLMRLPSASLVIFVSTVEPSALLRV